MKVSLVSLIAIVALGNISIGWPGQGKDALQEIELRTWSKPQFQAELLQNKAFISKKFDDFLAPLTKGFNHKYSHYKDDLISTMIKLWSYF
ncbi:hypothetical protein BKA61DRAFT_607280 [Leptodontidium sp. MPI-SDFR-AT-0119]|nr:hypothetical protein BKA61DRAFT_607280 [Leptodontidium sp. MPI-SDFR-AT-0119]